MGSRIRYSCDMRTRSGCNLTHVRRSGWQPRWQPRDSTPADTGRQPPNTVPGHRLKSTPVDTPRVPGSQEVRGFESLRLHPDVITEVGLRVHRSSHRPGYKGPVRDRVMAPNDLLSPLEGSRLGE